MSDKKRILRYLLFDLVSAFIAWQLFSIFRFYEVRSTIYFNTAWEFINNTKAYIMSACLPVFWVIIYYYVGYYSKPRLKNNASDLITTLVSTFLGALIIFFTIIINDYPDEYTQFYSVFIGLFLIHFFCTLLFRFVQTTSMLNQHAKGETGIAAAIIGTGEEALNIKEYLGKRKNASVFLAKGFIMTNDEVKVPQEEILGDMSCLYDITQKNHIESFIVASDNRDTASIGNIVNQLYPYHLEIHTTIHPQEVMFSDVSLYSIAGVPLRRITPAGMSTGEKNIKRTIDIIISFFALVLLSPLFAFLAIRVKTDSKGKVLYTQERLGYLGKTFRIIKFRTMFTDAESNGPLLSSLNDKRITPFGKIMRKYRLDELPQLWNVLIGDMSLVGPRPERAYYAEQIIRKAPQYHLIYSVKPGITSLGMVKYGYADSVEKMTERLEFDLIYLKNQSLLMDMKILVFTIKPLALGKGI